MSLKETKGHLLELLADILRSHLRVTGDGRRSRSGGSSRVTAFSGGRSVNGLRWPFSP